MLKALCGGQSDPEALAELALGKLRAKLPVLRRALQGRFSAHHALLVSHLLSHIEYLDEAIASLSVEIEERVAPFAHKRELLCTVPGIAERTAEVILAGLGPEMERFPSHRHAASWAAICPGNEQSAGKRLSGKTRKGDRWLRTALIEAAQAPPAEPRTPTSTRSISASSVGGGTRKRSSPSPIRSSSPSTTSSATKSLTKN